MSTPSNSATNRSNASGISPGAQSSSMKDLLLKMEHRARQKGLMNGNDAKLMSPSMDPSPNSGDIVHQAATEGVGTNTLGYSGPPPGLPHPPAYATPPNLATTTSGKHTARTDDLGPDKCLSAPKPRDNPSPAKKNPKGRKLGTVVVVDESPSETSSEELADRPLDPGDSAYRSGTTKSRVDPGVPGRAFSPPVTRRTARLQSAASVPSPAPEKVVSQVAKAPLDMAGSAPAAAPDPSPTSLFAPTDGAADSSKPNRPKPRPRQVKRSFAEDTNPPKKQSGTPPDGPAPHKKSRVASGHARISDVNHETLSVSSNALPEEQTFVDLEAEAEQGSGDEVMMEVDANMDQYDLDDPFIDDGPLASDARSSDHPAKDVDDLERSNMAQDLDTPGPDILGSDFSGFDSADDPWLASFFKKFKERRRKMKQRRERDAARPHAPTQHPRPVSSSKKGKARATIMSDDENNQLPMDEFPDEPAYDSMSDNERRAILQAVQASRAELLRQGRSGESSQAGVAASVVNASSAAPSGAQAVIAVPPTTPSTPSASGSMSMGDLLGRLTPSHTPAGSTPTASINSPVTPTPSPSQSTASPGTTRRCTRLPERCEVNDPSLQDPVLTGVYDNLPPLKAGHLVPWSDMPGPGQVFFSAWGDQCPNMNGLSALSALSLVDDGNFTNPSRSSPIDTEIREVPGGRFHLYRNGNPLVGVSPVFLEQSQLLTPSVSGLTQKYLRGIMHTQEWERFVAWTCMSFGHPSLSAQLAKDALQFSTRPRFETKDDNKKKSNGMFKNTRSPSTLSNATPNRVTADTFALPTDSVVPIYDARNTNFDFRHDLPGIANLPRWDQEIPYGSFVVVGYTLAVYRAKGGNWTLGGNIQWAVIVGVPADEP